MGNCYDTTKQANMKTDKLFYQIFINQQSLIHELLPDIPSDCQFEYSAPVVKETEFRFSFRRTFNTLI